MTNQEAGPCDRPRYWTGLLIATCALLSAPAAVASCRVSDFASRPLASLNEVQRLSFVRQMTQTEYDRLKRVASGDANYYSIIANSANRAETKQAAQTKLDSLHMQNSDDYAAIWASDFLDDEQSRNFVTCSSNRRPGIVFAGRLASPNTFNLSFAHLTPIGVEKIRLRVVASHNIANIDQFEAFLEQLGEKDNYAAQTFPLTLSKPNERAVVIVRAGWETPLFIYIPAYPWPDVH
jgi:hypothetical protein